MSWIENAGSTWRELNLDELDVDEAYLRISSEIKQNCFLYTLSSECYKCPFTRVPKEITHNKERIVKLGVAEQLTLKVFDKDFGKYAFSNESAFCEIAPNVGEFGVYNLTITADQKCIFEMDKEAVNIYLPFLLNLLILCTIIAVIKLSIFGWRKRQTLRNTSNDATAGNEDETETPLKVKKRLKSLDCFRGLSIVLMIFVNSGGGKYSFIDHTTWNGLHPADLVFPSFLWIMGVCIPISIRGQLNREVSKISILQNVLWRSFKLFIIGLCLNSTNGPTFENLRIMGVLQRFGIGYLFATTVHVIFSHAQNILPQSKIKRMFYDIIIIGPQWIFALVLVAVHLAIVYGLSVPGCPKGYMGPGGKHEMAAYNNCIGGATGYIDRVILGKSHIYQHPTAKYIYDSEAFDPEGVFGCLLTIVHVIIGLQCGSTLIIFSEWQARIKRWLCWSIVLGLLSGILCKFSKEEGWIPLNKNLWSLSFVLGTSSIAFLLLSICYYVIDIKEVWNGSPFFESGMNPIIMYVGHSVLHKILPWHWRVGLMNTHFVLLLECIWNTSLWVLIALYLHSKNIFYSL